MRRPFVLLTVAMLAGALLGSCGDDDSEPGAAGTGDRGSISGTVDVIARDIEFADDAYEVAAGMVELRYLNEGSITHTLLVDDVDGFELEVTSSGDQDQGTIDLESGSYTLYCDVPGHREAGMEATLEVA